MNEQLASLLLYPPDFVFTLAILLASTLSPEIWFLSYLAALDLRLRLRLDNLTYFTTVPRSHISLSLS